MNKNCKIDGELDEKDSTANVLNVDAARHGISLTEYIRMLLNNHAKALKKAR